MDLFLVAWIQRGADAAPAPECSIAPAAFLTPEMADQYGSDNVNQAPAVSYQVVRLQDAGPDLARLAALEAALTTVDSRLEALEGRPQ